MSHTFVTMSQLQNIDGLLSGVKWAGTSITFGFPTQGSQYGEYDHLVDHDDNPATDAITVNESTGLQPLNLMQQAAAWDAFDEVASLTLLGVSEVQPANDADIRLAMSTTRNPANTTAYAFYPGDDPWDGDVWFNTTDYNTPRLGTYAYQTFFHEIGHALGLKHGHEADNGNFTVLANDRDSLEFSTMTYRAHIGHPANGYGVTEGHYPQSFMMLDIAALQYMYGADFTTNSNATTYEFDPATGQMFVNGLPRGVSQNNVGTTNVNVLFRTIWDGGGNDTYDFSAYDLTRQLVVDLAPGGWIDVDADSNFQAADLRAVAAGTQIARGQVFNALLYENDLRSLIENAIGGAGDDTINGNQAENRLEGRGGNDTLRGLDGGDVLEGGIGNDTLTGGKGDDSLMGGAGIDTLVGSEGSVSLPAPPLITLAPLLP